MEPVIPNPADTSAQNAIFQLQARNREAEKVIANYARNHRWLDIGVGAIGTVVPVPGASLAAMLACIVAQGPLFYKPMANKLSSIGLLPVLKTLR